MPSRTPARLLCSAAVAAACVGVLVIASVKSFSPEPVSVLVPVAMAADLPPPTDVALAADARPAEDDLLTLSRRDPAAVFQRASERYNREIKDYRCTFLKQEKLADGLTPVQEIRVLYRQKPQSCFMVWKKNEGKARRALWIDDPKFVDAKGNRIAQVEPAGAVIRLVISDIMMPIHGADAKEQSRRAIDEFGFRSIFDLLADINAKATAKGHLDFKFEGAGEVDGRPTLIFRRYLPEGKAGEYPDAKMILHMDREWLLPVAVYSYSDRAGTDLLGSYVMTNVELNPGLTDEAFKF